VTNNNDTCDCQIIGRTEAHRCGERAAGRFVILGVDGARSTRVLCARHLDAALAGGWRVEPAVPA
jgi:hypothetical protein